MHHLAGILAEHLDTRNQAGLFDVTHMGRFIISGRDAPAFLQYALTNNAAALETGQSHHIIKGGHLSAQPMGALRDFVMRDPRTERPAVVNFPVLSENPYQIDIEACAALLDQHRPELVILGKSMIIHKEPVAAIRKLIEDLELDAILMYDMAHVLGLTGPNFQQPFSEGADLVTGSTQKTF